MIIFLNLSQVLNLILHNIGIFFKMLMHLILNIFLFEYECIIFM